MELIYGNLVGINQTTNIIPKLHLSLIEITGHFPNTWINFGIINVLINDSNLIENKTPIIETLRFTNQGLIYIPDHLFNYQLEIVPKPWLINSNSILNVYIKEI